MIRSLAVVSTILVSVLISGCGGESGAESEKKLNRSWLSDTGQIPEFTQRKGDPEKGRHALLHESYVNCGTPERVFRELQSAFSTDASVVEVDGRDASMDGLPFSTNLVTGITGTQVVSSNCLTCHGTHLFGDLVIGLGNEFADFTQNPSALVERAGALVRGKDEVAEWERFADRVAAIAPYTQMRTVGVNPANNLTTALISRRDAKTNAWLDTPALPSPPTNPPPVSVPPWWRMSKKHALFSMSEGRADHSRTMLAASMLCADTVEELNSIDAYAPDIRAYLSSLTPPSYPFDIDTTLAVNGQAVFEQSCAACHGTYGEQGSYPNTLVPIDVVNTDARLMELATGSFGKQYAQWFNSSWYGELSTAAPGKGYVAPPLDGIWATAPYLHNGSVPNIRQVLQPSKRPAVWRHVPTDATDPELYDSDNIGWRYEVIAERDGFVEDSRIYDTSNEGYGNGGHRFGESLDEAEVTALLEYLKTL